MRLIITFTKSALKYNDKLKAKHFNFIMTKDTQIVIDDLKRLGYSNDYYKGYILINDINDNGIYIDLSDVKEYDVKMI